MISANYAEMRIDIDAEESVHHVRLDTMVIFQFPLQCSHLLSKVSNFFKFPTLQEQFGLFLEQLQQHRLSVQHSLHLSVEEDHLEGEEREEVLCTLL